MFVLFTLGTGNPKEESKRVYELPDGSDKNYLLDCGYYMSCTYFESCGYEDADDEHEPSYDYEVLDGSYDEVKDKYGRIISSSLDKIRDRFMRSH